MSKRLLLVDPGPIAFLGLRHILQPLSSVELVHAQNLVEAKQFLSDQKFDLVLLEMYGNKGIHGVERLCREFPDARIVVFSGDLDSYLLTKAMRYGVTGYIDKSLTGQELTRDIEMALSGNAVWPEANRKRVSMGRIGERVELDEYTAVTRREYDVLKKMCDGLTNRQIADALSISYETVKEHVQNILQKMAMSDRTQVAVWAVARNVVTPESV